MPLTLDDLCESDQALLHNMKTCELSNQFFVIEALDGTEIELKPNGKQLQITEETREEWVSLVKDFKMSESKVQIDAIRSGISAVMPFDLLSMFTPQELGTLVTGSPVLDVELLKKWTLYEGYSSSDLVIQNFWKVLSSMDTKQQTGFLMFVWGRSRLPILMQDKFSVKKMTVNSADLVFPKTSTCFFTLQLPPYSTEEIMRKKLLFAIQECKTIDTDFEVHD